MNPPTTASKEQRAILLASVRAKLAACLQPQVLEIEDESAQHAGHAGAKEGKAHLRVRIVSERFHGCSLPERHRLVYRALAEEMRNKIHALAIEALTPAEWAARNPQSRLE